jgi:S1-C subfamily serine protease
MLIIKLIITSLEKGLRMKKIRLVCLLFIAATSTPTLASSSLIDSIKKIKPSVVAIGIFTPIEAKAPQILGTGFVVGNGRYIATNYHVVSKVLNPEVVQHYVAMAGTGPNPKVAKIEVVAIDPVHDIAILSMDTALPAVKLAGDPLVDEGTSIFFTGFPIGAVLGLYPATHQGIIAAIAPDINPARNADQLTVQMLARLKKPFFIYQLDATAYPGNSGSPVFDRNTNEVIAIINKVLVLEGKEAALTNPSGISYAIPVRELRKLGKTVDVIL